MKNFIKSIVSKKALFSRMASIIMASILMLSIFLLSGCSMDPETEEPNVTDKVVNEVINLKTDDGINPIAIDSEKPRFSWQLNSNIIGQRQKAYKIAVAKDSSFDNIVWTSQKVESDISVGIEYGGGQLLSSTRYFWKVDIWDKDDKILSSKTAFFETGIDSWDNSHFISAKSDVAEVPSNFHYEVEGDFTIQDSDVGLFFNGINSKNYYHWQISVIHGAGRVIIRPHSYINGAWDTYNNAHNADITNIISVEQIKTQSVHMRIAVKKDSIQTYVNDDPNPVSIIPNGGLTPYIGKLGVRSYGDGRGTVANLKVTDFTQNPSGTVVSDYKFDQFNPFFVGKVEDGAFVVYKVGDLLMPDTSSVFRKEFSIANGKTIKSARLYNTALGAFDSYINGKRVGINNSDGSVVYDELKPGFTMLGRIDNGSDPEVKNTRLNYYTYDVTDYLNNSTNTISAVVSTGWWTGAIGGKPGNQTAYRAKLLVTFTDGTKQWINSDTTWKASQKSPFLMADIWQGEAYDANVDTSYTKNGYNDSSWNLAEQNSEFSGMITAVIAGSQVKIRKDLELEVKSINVYSSISGAKEDRYGKINIQNTYGKADFILEANQTAIIDLGQNCSGVPSITAEGENGTVLTMRHGERLNDNEGIMARGNDGAEGSLFTANLHGAAATAVYIMKGGETESYHPTHTFFGFRYVELKTSRTVKVKGFSALVLTSVVEETGKLKTSDSNVNQLISNIKWGQYSNYLSIPTDCNQRAERQGWTADTQVFSTSGSYLADSKNFLLKWMLDMSDSQWPSGNFPEVAPRGCFRNEGAAGWSDAAIIVPYNLYKMYGDKNIITQNYQLMKDFMDFMESKKLNSNHNKASDAIISRYIQNYPNDYAGGLIIWGDWLGVESNDYEIHLIIAIAYFAYDAQMMAQMAQVIGKTEDAQKYAQLYETIKQQFINKFIDSSGNIIRSEQTACLMALKMGLYPNEDSKNKIIATLVNNIEQKGNKIGTGFIGTATIMQTLSDVGADETAYNLLLQRDRPSWLYCVDMGATTVWERWDGYTENGVDSSKSSYNHYSYGAVAEWMYGYMAGIMYDFDNPGFKSFVLQPKPNQMLSSVECEFNSPYGNIVSNWKYVNDDFTYNAVVPANTSATIYVPTHGKTLTVNGKAINSLSLETDGIKYINTADNVAQFSAVCGSFEFSTKINVQHYIFFKNSNRTTECYVKINGGELIPMPNALKVNKGETITIEAFAYNDAEYSFSSWSGDMTSTNSLISFTVQKSMSLNVNFEYIDLTNIALGALVSVSSQINGAQAWAPSNLTDGITVSSGNSMGYSSNTLGSTTPSSRPFIQLDLGSDMNFDRMHLYPRTGVYTTSNTTCNFPIEFYIEAKTASGEFEKIYEYTGTAPLNKPLAVQLASPINARYIKLTVIRVSPSASDEQNNRVQLSEFSVYNTK